MKYILIIVLGLLIKLSLQGQTIDSLKIGDASSATSHNLTGVNMNTGISNGRSWINATNGSFSFDLAIDSVARQDLKCTYWGSDAGNRKFTIYMDGIKLSDQALNNNKPYEFFSVTYTIPLSLTRHKTKVNVKFRAGTDSTAGDLYGCQVLKSQEQTPYWPAGIHDPSSIIKCGDTYWVFGTGDGIYSLYSKDLVGWRTGPTPFAKWDIPSWIFPYVPKFEGSYWAPECIYMNGKYYLYYSASQWGVKLSCIGVTVNTTLDPSDPRYHWTDLGLIVSSYHTSDYNAIDPSVMRDPKSGSIWMVYGSFNYGGIKVVELDSVTGKAKNINSATSVCNNPPNYGGEGAAMVYHKNYYYLFVNFGGCCEGINSTYYVVMGRSTNPYGPFYDKNGVNLFNSGGGSLFFKHDNTKGTRDRYYGPGHLGYFAENGTEYVTFHYYDPNFPYPGQPAGGPMLGIGKITWDASDWPVLSFDWLDKGRYKIQNKNSGLYWNSNTSSNPAIVTQAMETYANTQLWDFTPLGTGEYKISNAALPARDIEADGTNHDGWLLQNTYTDSIYQKFRVLKSVNNELIFYQSNGLRTIEVPFGSLSAGQQLGLWYYSDGPNQKWYATKVVDVPNGLKQAAYDNRKIFPNPAQDVVVLEGFNQPIKADFYSITGELLLSETLTNHENKINISPLKTGIYLVKIKDDDHTDVHKIIKQ